MSKVLVVDDERLMRDLLGALLTRHGHDVITAASGPEGLELFRTHRPQLTVLDLSMPDMDGIAVLRRLRAIDEQAAVVVLTGTGTDDLENQARQLGVTDFLKKALSPDVIVAALERASGQVAGSAASTAPGAALTPPEGEASILVVEDEPNSREMVTQFLLNRGYHVRSAPDGAEALFMVQEQAPHLIVLDLYMPGMNGIEVIKTLKRRDFRGSIIVLTGSQDEKLLEQALELGSVDVLGKPVDLDRLMLAIDVGLLLSGSPTPMSSSRATPAGQAKPVAASTTAPDATRARQAPVEPQETRPGRSRPEILVVEDEPDASRLLRDYLLLQGYAVKFAATGAEALSLLQKRTPDVLIMDLSMPGVNGVEMLRRLQTSRPNGLPFGVIIQTGSAGDALLDQARALGHFEILHKPVDFKQLDAAIKLQLKHKS
jgi:CheY-like chemotaxis protein